MRCVPSQLLRVCADGGVTSDDAHAAHPVPALSSSTGRGAAASAVCTPDSRRLGRPDVGRLTDSPRSPYRVYNLSLRGRYRQWTRLEHSKGVRTWAARSRPDRLSAHEMEQRRRTTRCSERRPVNQGAAADLGVGQTRDETNVEFLSSRLNLLAGDPFLALKPSFR